MRRRKAWISVLAVAALVAGATATDAAPTNVGNEAWRLCADAIAAHERTQRIPRHLLAAIGIAESGRWDAERKIKAPWPWTVNAEGKGRFYASKDQAVRAVRELRTRDVRNIDVGCMQISLLHHPDAFADLDQAFEPASNVGYGARYLKTLFGETRSWQRAAGRYHSSTPKRARAYRLKVVKLWNEQRRLARLEPRRNTGRAMVPVDRERSEALNAWGRRMAANARAIAAATPTPERLADDRWSREAALLGGLERALRRQLMGEGSPRIPTSDRRRLLAAPSRPVPPIVPSTRGTPVRSELE